MSQLKMSHLEDELLKQNSVILEVLLNHTAL